MVMLIYALLGQERDKIDGLYILLLTTLQMNITLNLSFSVDIK